MWWSIVYLEIRTLLPLFYQQESILGSTCWAGLQQKLMVGSRLQNPSVLTSFWHNYINVPCTLTTQIHTLLHSIAEVCWYIFSSHIFMQTLIAPKLKLTAVAVNCATILRNSQRQCQIQFLYQWSGMLLPHKLENKSLQFNC